MTGQRYATIRVACGPSPAAQVRRYNERQPLT